MPNRREFLKNLAGAAGICFVGCDLLNAVAPPMQAGGARKRREVRVGGRRVRTVDIHAHCGIPDILELFQEFRQQLDTPTGLDSPLWSLSSVDERLRLMDEQGIDMQAVSLNPFWYRAERDLARRIVQLQNERIAALCAAHPDRFVGLGTVALQHPDLAAEQLDEGVKKFGMRGFAVGGSVNGEELAAPKFHPFWAKAEELGTLIFIHPQGFADGLRRFQGNGALFNVIGNPLETTVALSHLIFEGTLDRFPQLKICAAHAGGFLPSYIGRSDRCVTRSPNPCKEVRPMQKRPSEYLKQLYFDSMVFTGEGLRHLVAEAGVSQILLGTDFPAGWTTEGVDHVLSTPSLSNADKRAILGDNAAKLLRLPAS